jgi:hypothetical protein
MSADKYRRRSAEFFHLAEATTDQGHKTWLLELAQSWLDLAEQSEKNAAADLCYETPPPKGD